MDSPRRLVVTPEQTADFLTKCATQPKRWFYPASANHRPPRNALYNLRHQQHHQQSDQTLHQPDDKPTSRPRQETHPTLAIPVDECAYNQGGTGWRVWPGALLLACYLARHHAALELARRSVLELGCGLGLPGLAAAALGARAVTLTDCLPKLLAAVRASAAANPEAHRIRVGRLDWDAEAPPADDVAEHFSTEQGVKSLQFDAGLAHEEPAVDAAARFDLILASDVIYSMRHARQLPRVIARRVDAGGRLCMLVPVRSAEHTRELLRGLLELGMRVCLGRVDAEWVASVVGVQQQPQQRPQVEARAAVPLVAGWDQTCVAEGEIFFIEASMPTALPTYAAERGRDASPHRDTAAAARRGDSETVAELCL